MQLIFQMKFIEGFTEQKIANHLGINQSTVSRKIKKIIEIIKKTKDANYKQLYEDKYFTIYERLNA